MCFCDFCACTYYTPFDAHPVSLKDLHIHKKSCTVIWFVSVYCDALHAHMRTWVTVTIASARSICNWHMLRLHLVEVLMWSSVTLLLLPLLAPKHVYSIKEMHWPFAGQSEHYSVMSVCIRSCPAKYKNIVQQSHSLSASFTSSRWMDFLAHFYNS